MVESRGSNGSSVRTVAAPNNLRMGQVEEHEAAAAQWQQSFTMAPASRTIDSEPAARATTTTPPPPSKPSLPSGPNPSPQASANRARLPSTPKSLPGGTKMSSKTKWVVVGVVAAVIVCVGIFAVMVGREVASLTLIENLQQGECVEDFFEESPGGEFVEVFFVRTVDCTAPHAYNVYAASDLVWDESAYPGVNDAFAIGDGYCGAEFEALSRSGGIGSSHEFLTFVPTVEMWESGDRTVRCLVGNADGLTLTPGLPSASGGQVER